MAEYAKDSWASSVIEGTIQDSRYTVVNDLIIYKERIYLVPESSMKQKILRACHDSPLVGHPRFFKTYRQVRKRFTWKGLKTKVFQFVRECQVCQQNKQEHSFPSGLLQPLPIPEKKWDSISMDFITSLPKARGWDCVLLW